MTAKQKVLRILVFVDVGTFIRDPLCQTTQWLYGNLKNSAIKGVFVNALVLKSNESHLGDISQGT